MQMTKENSKNLKVVYMHIESIHMDLCTHTAVPSILYEGHQRTPYGGIKSQHSARKNYWANSIA